MPSHGTSYGSGARLKLGFRRLFKLTEGSVLYSTNANWHDTEAMLGIACAWGDRRPVRGWWVSDVSLSSCAAVHGVRGCILVTGVVIVKSMLGV